MVLGLHRVPRGGFLPTALLFSVQYLSLQWCFWNMICVQSLWRLLETTPIHPLNQRSLGVWGCALLPAYWLTGVWCEHALFTDAVGFVHLRQGSVLKFFEVAFPLLALESLYVLQAKLELLDCRRTLLFSADCLPLFSSACHIYSNFCHLCWKVRFWLFLPL